MGNLFRLVNRPKLTILFGHSQVRRSSSASALIVRQDVPAPHCGTIRVLRLNNPRTRNAISRALLAELRDHINDITREGSKEGTRALIIASNIDGAFCAGADLKERSQFSQEETQKFLTDLRATFTSLSCLPIPSITALSSLALGGGLELALCTHLRVFASTATVALPESRLAIIPGAGGTYRLPALIGRTRALDMMLTGRRVAAAEAYFFGLCDRLISVELQEDDRVITDDSIQAKEARLLNKANNMVTQASIDLAREICGGGPISIQQLVKLGMNGSLADSGRGQEQENEAYGHVVDTRDRDEALAAFKEKRKPVFMGK